MIAFDTFETIKRLQGFGFEARQAEGVTETLKDIIASSGEDYATKNDLKDVETALKSEIKEVETSLKSEIASVRSDIAVLSANVGFLKWGVGAVFAGVLSLMLKTFILGG
jgi:ethanolamine utilization microcompartment shell protein EutS